MYEYVLPSSAQRCAGMGAFQRIYSDAQRDALEHTWGDRNIRPAERVAQLAARGELTSPSGEQLEPFTVPAQTVRDIGRRYLRRRAGLERSRVAELEPADALEQLRRRLISAADHELERIERAQLGRRGAGAVDPERMRQIARAVREIAAIPSSRAPAVAPPPDRARRARSGLAGQILRAGARGASSPTANGSSSEPAPLEPVSEPRDSRGETDAHTGDAHTGASSPDAHV